jgi:hypothetical protein
MGEGGPTPARDGDDGRSAAHGPHGRASGGGIARGVPGLSAGGPAVGLGLSRGISGVAGGGAADGLDTWTGMDASTGARGVSTGCPRGETRVSTSVHGEMGRKTGARGRRARGRQAGTLSNGSRGLSGRQERPSGGRRSPSSGGLGVRRRWTMVLRGSGLHTDGRSRLSSREGRMLGDFAKNRLPVSGDGERGELPRGAPGRRDLARRSFRGGGRAPRRSLARVRGADRGAGISGREGRSTSERGSGSVRQGGRTVRHGGRTVRHGGRAVRHGSGTADKGWNARQGDPPPAWRGRGATSARSPGAPRADARCDTATRAMTPRSTGP